MLRTNAKALVAIAVEGRVAPPLFYGPFEVSHAGVAESLPSLGGITYNVKVGDPVRGWAGDHVEPGVSAVLDPNRRGERPNQAFNYLACAGNAARVVSGGAKGAKGVVLGHHGGVEHVLLDFPDRDLERMTLEDRIQIRAFGQGLKLLDHPDVHVLNLDPGVLPKWGLRPRRDGTLEVPVTAVLPPEVMGSGLGSQPSGTGDYDIMTSDGELVRELKLDALRLGDFVAIRDHDGRYGRALRRGALTVGLVVHADSVLAGHGPGVMTVLTCPTPRLRPRVTPAANLGRMLGLGRFRRARRGP